MESEEDVQLLPTVLASKKLREERAEIEGLNLEQPDQAGDPDSFDDFFTQIDNVQITLQFIDELIKEVYDGCGKLQERAPCLRCGNKFPNIVCLPCRHVVVCSSCVEASTLISCPYCNFPVSSTEARHLTHEEIDRILTRPHPDVPVPTELEIRQFNLELVFNQFDDTDLSGYLPKSELIETLRAFDRRKGTSDAALTATQTEAMKQAAKSKDKVWVDDALVIAARMCTPLKLDDFLGTCDRLLKS